MDGINTIFNLIAYTKKSDDEDMARIFVSKLEKITHKLHKEFYKKPKPLKLTTKEKEEYKAAEFCHICKEKLFDEDRQCQLIKVRDHCHFTGKYRGAAHRSCNLQCRKPIILPVLLHNLQGYQSACL